MLDLDREDVGGRTARDSYYLKSFLEAQGACQTHTTVVEPIPAEYDPNLFDIGDPSTWPTQEQWPGFDPNNTLTWPLPPVEPTGPPPVPTASPPPVPPVAVETPPPSYTEPFLPGDVPPNE